MSDSPWTTDHEDEDTRLYQTILIARFDAILRTRPMPVLAELRRWQKENLISVTTAQQLYRPYPYSSDMGEVCKFRWGLKKHSQQSDDMFVVDTGISCSIALGAEACEKIDEFEKTSRMPVLLPSYAVETKEEKAKAKAHEAAQKAENDASKQENLERLAAKYGVPPPPPPTGSSGQQGGAP